MSDHGEKIVHLAYELLQSGAYAETEAEPPLPKITVSFKILCLTTLLAASAGAGATEWVHDCYRPLNHYEKTELNALVFYAASLRGLTEDAMRAEVAEHLGLPGFDDMTETEFRAARRYLQERAG